MKLNLIQIKMEDNGFIQLVIACIVVCFVLCLVFL